ncbi:MAG: DUF4288 domain-containing protein [Chitinophagaceae bacterium]|nr:MAG: DUF4288 domain-containing protein [Chitinophagaceae bacterium]
MQWFLAKIVYRITCGDGQHQAQFDEQLRLLQASTEAEALERATEIGLAGEERFRNQDAQLVAWTFVNIPELYPLHAQLDGAELYSQVRETDDASAYVNFVHYKAHCIRARAEQTDSSFASFPL